MIHYKGPGVPCDRQRMGGSGYWLFMGELVNVNQRLDHTWLKDFKTTGISWKVEMALIKKLGFLLSHTNLTVLILITLQHFHELRYLESNATGKRILLTINRVLVDNVQHYLPQARILAMENLWGDDFLVFLGLPAEVAEGKLLDFILALKLYLKDNLGSELIKLNYGEIWMQIGYACIENDLDLPLGLKLFFAIKEARERATGMIDIHALKLAREFKELLANKGLATVYQPIFDLRSGEIIGWEALVRGPVRSYFERPDAIFSFAEENGLLYPTEKVCRAAAIGNIGQLGRGQKLFLNVHPRTINDPAFVQGETLTLLQDYGLNPADIVFEITERHSINDYAHLKGSLEHYRNQGYQVAIDDVGTGFAGLYSITEIRPDFIKIDMSLVRNINNNFRRRSAVQAMVTMANKNDCQVIAEGIETRGELNTLLEIGVAYGQGYYLAKPDFPKPLVSETVIGYVLEQVLAKRDIG